MQELLDQQLHSTLKTYFGYDTFRPEQETVIRQILSGRDVFAVMLYLQSCPPEQGSLFAISFLH